MTKKLNGDLPTLSQLRTELARERYKNRFIRILWSTIFALVVVAAATVLVAVLWLPILEIYGTSMEPNLAEGEIVVAFNAEKLDRGDIVAFYYGNKILVKRVIGLPDDLVSIDENGVVTVNGEVLDEPYVSELSLGECDISFPYTVPMEKYFVIGDKRSTSLDSRNSAVGCVQGDQISGKVVLRVWPLSKFGLIRNK